MNPKKLILVKASVAGDWFPNSCMGLVKVNRRRLDVDGLYEALGVEPDATEAEIKSAAKKRMLESHPDVGGDEKEFEIVLKAYKTLSNSGKRAEYDSMERHESITISLRSCDIGEHIEPVMKRACFYKGMSDMLMPDDIERAYAWQDMVLEAAHEFGASFDVKVGVSSKIDGYAIQDGIAVKPNKSNPDKGMAKSYVLYKMVTKGETKC